MATVKSQTIAAVIDGMGKRKDPNPDDYEGCDYVPYACSDAVRQRMIDLLSQHGPFILPKGDSDE